MSKTGIITPKKDFGGLETKIEIYISEIQDIKIMANLQGFGKELGELIGKETTFDKDFGMIGW